MTKIFQKTNLIRRNFYITIFHLVIMKVRPVTQSATKQHIPHNLARTLNWEYQKNKAWLKNAVISNWFWNWREQFALNMKMAAISFPNFRNFFSGEAIWRLFFSWYFANTFKSETWFQVVRRFMLFSCLVSSEGGPLDGAKVIRKAI